MMTLPHHRKTRLSLLSGSGLLILLGVLTFVNLLAARFFVRVDGTSDHRYSLSSASRSLLKSLEDPVHLRFYLTPNLPQPDGSGMRKTRRRRMAAMRQRSAMLLKTDSAKQNESAQEPCGN